MTNNPETIDFKKINLTIEITEKAYLFLEKISSRDNITDFLSNSSVKSLLLSSLALSFPDEFQLENTEGLNGLFTYEETSEGSLLIDILAFQR